MNYTNFPTYEAVFNGMALISMLVGYVAIRSGRERLHRNLMLAAIVFSALFLGLYLTYHFNVPSKAYTGDWGVVYYPILITHIVLAAIVPFLVARVVFLAFTERRQDHRRWARVTFPIWVYVSVTGIVVYFFVHF